jgi:hypothetical protein
MKVSVTCAHNYVVDGLDLIPLENAQAVLRMELQRLDGLLSAFYGRAIEGHDLPATYAVLKILDARAKLLGLHPREGQQAQLLIAAAAAGESAKPFAEITFVVPTGNGSDHRSDVTDLQVPRVTPQPPTPPWGYHQRRLPPPEPSRDRWRGFFASSQST